MDGQIVQFRPRATLIAPPGVSHFLVSESEDADFIVAVLAPDLVRGPPIHPPLAEDGALDLHALDEGAFRRISDLSFHLSALPEPAALELGMAWWLHVVWGACRGAERLTQDHVHPAVATALTLLRDDPARSIAQIANTVAISGDHLSVLFRKEMGVSMVQYRTELRLEMVERLVQGARGYGLEQAALAAGFREYSSFYRAFRKARGQPPKVLTGGEDRP